MIYDIIKLEINKRRKNMRKVRKLRRLYRDYLTIKYFAPIIISVGGAIIAKYGGDIQVFLKGILK